MSDTGFETLKGLTISNINGMENGSGNIEFITSCGRVFQMFHEQDCCETVVVEDVCGDVEELLNNPILMAEVETHEGSTTCGDTRTWTFYKLATASEYVTIRWLGESNGYYSEVVSFVETTPDRGGENEHRH
jgi:hypothetical protein